VEKKTKVLIVDDSALVRRLLLEILSAEPSFDVVGAASDPYIAREKIKKLNPDVVTLDVEMPRMDGITFLENLMRLRPMPVVMVSSLTQRGAETTLRALELGAVDFVAKPKVDVAGSLSEYSEEIVAKVKMAARARVRSPIAKTGDSRTDSTGRFAIKAESTGKFAAGHMESTGRFVSEKLSADAVLPPVSPSRRMLRTTDRIIAIGASTGGTEALRELLAAMPPDAPGIVICQHIPAAFSGAFAERLNQASAMSVVEAADGQYILPGHAYVAPGDKHLVVERDGARYRCRLSEGSPVNRHRPSVDVLFRSVAQKVGPNAIGAILTGMGDDGARGLKEMRDAGAATVAQDEASSVVWGMPGSAVRLGAAEQVVALRAIPPLLLDLASKNFGGKSDGKLDEGAMQST
jgi:two-component system, chemotaxis family, protein-glutamate methylesterase/glutaminase